MLHCLHNFNLNGDRNVAKMLFFRACRFLQNARKASIHTLNSGMDLWVNLWEIFETLLLLEHLAVLINSRFPLWKIVKVEIFLELGWVSGNVWDCLGLSGTVWDCLGLCGTVWDRLEPWNLYLGIGWDFEDKEEVMRNFWNATPPRAPGGANK